MENLYVLAVSKIFWLFKVLNKEANLFLSCISVASGYVNATSSTSTSTSTTSNVQCQVQGNLKAIRFERCIGI